MEIKPSYDNNFKALRLDVEQFDEKKCNSSFFKLFIIGVAIGFINGFWGGGGGMVCVPTMIHMVKLPEKVAHATTILIMLPLCVSSLIVYYAFGGFDQTNLLPVLVGFVGGGIIGALVLKKINNLLLMLIFSLIIIAGGIKLIV